MMLMIITLLFADALVLDVKFEQKGLSLWLQGFSTVKDVLKLITDNVY